MPNAHFRQAVALLGTRRFGTYWGATLLANIGTWAQQVAQPWLMLSLGASPFLLGLDAFALGAPVMLLTLVGGMLADRTDRRRTIALFQTVQMLCPILLVLGVVTQQVQPWMVIALSLVVGVTDALSMPSFQSIVPTIVTREQLPAGIALNTTQFNLSRILGPALAGALMASVGLAGAFAVSAASYVPFILVAWWVLPRSLPAANPSADAGQAPRLAHVATGVRGVLAEPGLRWALLTVLTSAVLCAPLITFIPVLVKTELHGGAAQFSGAMGAFGVGGLLGAVALLTLDPQRDRRPVSSAAALAFAVVVALAALNPSVWALPLLLVAGGVAMTASNASANALLQAHAPAHLRGQAVSLFMLAMRGGVALGSVWTGLLVHALGVRGALLSNALVALAAQALIGWRWRWRARYSV